MSRVRTCQFSILTSSAPYRAAGGPVETAERMATDITSSGLVDRVTPFLAVPDSLDSRRTGHHFRHIIEQGRYAFSTTFAQQQSASFC